MKKVLLATSILAATAGFAAAEVTVSGSARMGLLYNGEDVNFTGRARVNFTASGETDAGLAFGYSVRADQASNANNGLGSGSVFISGAFGKLSMGDVAGAAEAAVGDLSGVGLTGLGDFSDTVFITGDGAEVETDDPIILYEYSTGALTFYLSGNDGNDDGGDLFGSGASGGPEDQAMALGVAYSSDTFGVSLGYEMIDFEGSSDDASHLVLGATATLGSVSLKAVYGVGDGDFVEDFDQYGISASTTFGQTTVTGFYKAVDFGGGSDGDAIGLGASYDLGGGAKLVGGIVNYNDDGGWGLAGDLGADVDPDGETVADFGVSFTF